MKLMTLILVLALAGCASQPQTIHVPVPTPCQASVPAEPEYNFPKLTKQNTMFEAVRALLADRELSLAYELELRAIVDTCTK